MRTCLHVVVDVGDGRGRELAADALWQLGAVAVEERADCLVAGFVDDAAVRGAHDAMAGRRWRTHVVEVPPDWRDALRSPPCTVEVVSGVCVDIDPGRVFGNGAHPTTRMALDALARLVRPGDRVLDVGCGSGVLSVAAARLGASSVVAVDVDPEAVDATMANARRNGAGDVVHASTMPVADLADAADVAGAFDVVVANLGGRLVVESLADALAARTAGALVVAGLLDDGVAPPVIGWLVVADVVASDGWRTVVYRCP